MEVSPHHPQPLPSTHHRKIELQSPADLTYLQSNLSRTAQDKLDLHFPRLAYQKPALPATFISLDGRPQDTSNQNQSQQPQTQPAEEHDPLRAKVNDLVNAFLTRTWSSAAHSISINGLDATSLLPPPSQNHTSTSTTETSGEETEREGKDFTYTPYDARLQTQVASLYGELEALTAQVSKLRREAPKSGAEAYAEKLNEEIQADEEGWEAEMRELREQQMQDQEQAGAENIGTEGLRQSLSQRQRQAQNPLSLSQQRDGYYTDMQATYKQSLAELSRLAGVPKSVSAVGGQAGTSLTETVGKVQRARTVAMEFD